MTTLEIENEANSGQIANADFNVGICLRRAIIPEFLDGVGNPGWRRRIAFSNVVAGDTGFTLPRDFLNMEGVYMPQCSCSGGLPFIGDDPGRMAGVTTTGTAYEPSGYYISNTPGPGVQYFQRLNFTAPLDKAYAVTVIYYFQAVFPDNTSDVDLSQYIPEHFQYSLIYGLRRDIYIDRYGQGDPRADAAAAKFNDGITNAKRGDMELARVHRPRFIR